MTRRSKWRAWWLLWFTGGAHASAPIAPADLATRLAQADAPVVIDVRTQEEYAAGHVPGALLIPYDQIADRLAEIPAGRPLVLYCRSGRRSGVAEAVLAEHGIAARQLDGSWLAWEAAGLPVERAPEQGR